MSVTPKQNHFKSNFITSILSLFYSAETMVKSKQDRMKVNQENYKGQLLDAQNQMEKKCCQDNLDIVCRQMEKLRDKEIELLTKQKESDLRQPPIRTLENLENIKDIITEGELQLYADKCKESTLVQRRISRIAEERGMLITTYPDFDRKIEAVKEIATVFISYIKYENFGMEPAVYESMELAKFDNILEPIAEVTE